MKFMTGFLKIFNSHPFTRNNYQENINIIQEKIDQKLYSEMIVKKLLQINPKLTQIYSTPFLKADNYFNRYKAIISYNEQNFHVMNEEEKIEARNNEIEEINFAVKNASRTFEQLSGDNNFTFKYKIQDEQFIVDMNFMIREEILYFNFSIRNKCCFHNKTSFKEWDLEKVANRINDLLLNAERIITNK